MGYRIDVPPRAQKDLDEWCGGVSRDPVDTLSPLPPFANPISVPDPSCCVARTLTGAGVVPRALSGADHAGLARQSAAIRFE